MVQGWRHQCTFSYTPFWIHMELNGILKLGQAYMPRKQNNLGQEIIVFCNSPCSLYEERKLEATLFFLLLYLANLFTMGCFSEISSLTPIFTFLRRIGFGDSPLCPLNPQCLIFLAFNSLNCDCVYMSSANEFILYNL